MTTKPISVAALGECMVELARERDGRLRQGYGGDTLNTAVYLARLGVTVDYLTALGDDPYSDQMLAAWQAEGVGVGQVTRAPGRVPGLYIIETDAQGERQFYYWRDRAPAREVFALRPELAARIAEYDAIYLSGITLSLYGEATIAKLVKALAAARQGGTLVVFDSNYRPRGWPDAATARAAFRQLLAHSDLALPTLDDERLLGHHESAAECARRLHGYGVAEVVVKQGADGVLISAAGGEPTQIAVEAVANPVDTTAAGDSFNAGYLAAKLAKASAADAARNGCRLAAAVIRHRGAIIPLDAMPDGLLGR